MTIEFALKIIFFSALGVLVLLEGYILWMLKKAVEKGDVNAAYWGVRGIPFLPRKIRDKIILKALDNRDARELEFAKERRRDVVQLLRKIPGLELTQTGLGEEPPPSRR